MLKKIREYLLELLWAPSGTALLTFAIMLLLSIFNLINTSLYFSGNWWMIIMLPIAFILPFYFFRLSRGGNNYVPTVNFGMPEKAHLPTVIFSSALLFLGSALIKMLIIDGKYIEFPLYNTFFAHRNGNLFNDIYLLLMFCIIPPIFEGIIFRGAFIKEHDKRGRLVVTVFSSLMFSILSFSFEELVPRFFVGVMLCIILYATDSLILTIAIHIAYNFFAVFFEPTIVSIKTVSSNYELFAYMLAILTLAIAIALFAHLSRLYRKYSHDKFGESFVKSTGKEKSFWNLVELCTSIPSIACLVLYFVVTLLIGI